MKSFLVRSLTFVTKPFVEIRAGERTKTLLMFLYFSLTVGVIYVLKPVQKSLFLTEFGADNMRFINIGEGVFLILVVSLYVEFAKRASRRFFYFGLLGFFITNLLLFRVLFAANVPYLSAVFYLWQASFSITLTTIFWTLANDLFNANEARRLFGLIISGGSIGGILGGFLTSHAVRTVGTENLLLVSAGIVGLCMVVVALLWRLGHHGENETESKATIKERETKEQDQGSVFQIFKGSSYLVMLCAIVIMAKMVATIIDNQFGGLVEMSVSGKDAMTAFYGGFYGWLNMLSFIMQIVVTSLALRYLGVGISIWILPVGLVFLSFASFLYPVLAVGICLKMYDGSVNYSVQQASKEVLYLPIAGDIRRRIKPVIDMLGYRGAKAFAGIYIAFMAPLLNLPVEKLGLLALTLIPLWFWIAWMMRHAYSKLLRKNLLSKTQYAKTVETKRATDVLSFLHDEKSFEEAKSFMNHRSTYARKLAATAYFVAYGRSARDVKTARKIVDQMAQQEAFDKIEEAEDAKALDSRDLEFLNNLMGLGAERGSDQPKSVKDYVAQSPETILMKLAETIREDAPSLDAKRRAIRVLEHLPRQETVDLLLHTLAATQDHAFRFVMAKALVRLHNQRPSLEINRIVAKSEIGRETAIHKRIQQVSAFYNQGVKKTKGEDYLGVALTAIRDENIERIFHYLSLLYPHELMQMIHQRLIDHDKSDPTHVHALELLSNTLGPDLAIMIQRVLDGTDVIQVREEEVVDILKSFVVSGDRWFSLISQFLIDELALAERWPELKQLERFSISPSDSKNV
ncbi:MAG: Npt1/Npt2 family nucleotide transporter [Candidatus Omnitrophota bacterium]|nr:Npt1/Npt2 family nucleotide transporter [Candidatus Omnitrophota bacterium]